MGKYYLKGLEITEDNFRVIVTGDDYQGNDFGGVFPKEMIKDGKLEVTFLQDEHIGNGCFPKVKPVKGFFESKREVLVRLDDVERRVI